MTNEEILKLTREAGMSFHLGMPHEAVMEQLRRFADAVLASQPIAEPVAWMDAWGFACTPEEKAQMFSWTDDYTTPLYTSPGGRRD